MFDTLSQSGDEEWVIWNGSLGLVATASLGEIEQDATGRKAWMAEPFEMLGPFDLDELEARGRIAFAACIVLSRQRWREDQAALRQDSLGQRRAAQQRMHEAFARGMGGQAGAGQRRNGQQTHFGKRASDEREHREALKLPMEGKLERRQINAAFRRLAQKAHPDVGGSHEQFVRITTARTALLETVS